MDTLVRTVDLKAGGKVTDEIEATLSISLLLSLSLPSLSVYSLSTALLATGPGGLQSGELVIL